MPFIGFLLLLVAAASTLLWIQIERTRLQNQAKAIYNLQSDEASYIKELLDELTLKEKEIFDLIVSGNSNKQIMENLFIELSTLKTHINHIYKKLRIKSRKEAVALNRKISD